VTRDARARFEALAALPDEAIDLALGALLIAAEACPDLDVAAYLARLDALAAHAGREVPAAAPPRERVLALNRFLFEAQGFRGNRTHYDDPRNSYLNEVLERRTGLPITLCVLYVEVARRIALPVHGVGFPGHFLARLEGTELVIDAFGARVLAPPDCAALLRQVAGPDAAFDARLLAPTPSREILARMLRNLKQHWWRQHAFESALACCDRILLLLPDLAEEWRDRGLVWRELECFGPAARDLERALALAPDAPWGRAVATELGALRRRAAALH
jgi:regulator of sirC expression with transglutaminase-like and TPR domain